MFANVSVTKRDCFIVASAFLILVTVMAVGFGLSGQNRPTHSDPGSDNINEVCK